MAHTVIGCWECADTTILEFDAIYTYPDGHAQRAPSVALIRRDAHGLTTSLRIYVDKHR